ncbi:FKBP-type peptidyl-prolyl cis-trans isomerase slpA [Burkholderia sp. AU4i]|nr:FKBP-type peptidyl-prolyl cis-trans isomerase slpA [Burkholderia sp. AU4i]
MAAGGMRDVVALSALRAQVTYNIGFAPGLSAVSGADRTSNS